MVTKLISCSLGGLSYRDIRLTLCHWEAQHLRLCMKVYSHPFLPTFFSLKGSSEVENIRQLKNKWPYRICLSIIWREPHALPPEGGFTQNLSPQTNPCARPWTQDVLSPAVCSSFPNTSEEPQPMANRWKINASLTESQPYPNKLENFHFQTNSRLEINSGIKVQTVSPVACQMSVIKTALA